VSPWPVVVPTSGALTETGRSPTAGQLRAIAPQVFGRLCDLNLLGDAKFAGPGAREPLRAGCFVLDLLGLAQGIHHFVDGQTLVLRITSIVRSAPEQAGRTPRNRGISRASTTSTLDFRLVLV